MPNTIGPQAQVMYEPTVNKVADVAKQPMTPNDIVIPPPTEKKEGSSALAKALTGLAVIGTAGYLLYGLRKGGGIPEKTLEAFKAAGGKIEHGIAKNADGTLFEGIISHKGPSTGNSIKVFYQNGRMQKAFKNFDGVHANPDKSAHYMKEYGYDANGKLSVIKRTTLAEDGKKIETAIVPMNIKTVNIEKGHDFAASGGKFVKDKPVNADGTDFNGAIVEKSGDDILIREYKDGKQVSERLNTRFNDKEFKNNADAYSLDADDLAEREEEIFNRMLEAEKAVVDENKKKAKIGELIGALGEKKAEDAKPLNRLKNLFSGLFSSKKS